MTRDEAYDLLDRRLRAGYDDYAYAELSAALELCFTDEADELRRQLAAMTTYNVMLRDGIVDVLKKAYLNNAFASTDPRKKGK